MPAPIRLAGSPTTGIMPTTSSTPCVTALPQLPHQPFSSLPAGACGVGALFPPGLGLVCGTMIPCVLPMGPGLRWEFGFTRPQSGMQIFSIPDASWYPMILSPSSTSLVAPSSPLMVAAVLRLLEIHPHGVARAHELTTVDVDAAALGDVVADQYVGLRDDALAHP